MYRGGSTRLFASFARRRHDFTGDSPQQASEWSGSKAILWILTCGGCSVFARRPPASASRKGIPPGSLVRSLMLINTHTHKKKKGWYVTWGPSSEKVRHSINQGFFRAKNLVERVHGIMGHPCINVKLLSIQGLNHFKPSSPTGVTGIWCLPDIQESSAWAVDHWGDTILVGNDITSWGVYLLMNQEGLIDLELRL